MKRCLLGLLLLLLLPLMGCTQRFTGPAKIGIITNTRAQAETIYHTAQRLQAEHAESGESVLFHETWPDNFMDTWQQTRLPQIIADFCADNALEALILDFAIPGTAVALAQIDHQGLFLAACSPQDAAADIAPQADLLLTLDYLSMEQQMVEQAAKMGAQTLVYYVLESRQGLDYFELPRDRAAQTAKELGLNFVTEIILDNCGSSTVPLRTQLDRDVARQVELHGPDTAFYVMSIGLQGALIEAVLNHGAIFAQFNYPTPYLYASHPQPLGIEAVDLNAAALNAQVADKLNERGMLGRFTSYPVDYEELELQTALAYAERWLSGGVGREGLDLQALQEIMEEIAGVPCYLKLHEYEGVAYENYVEYYFASYIIN